MPAGLLPRNDLFRALACCAVLVGINHPWVKCGHDFGPRPPAWGGDRAERDFGEIERELSAWRELGVRVSRFWVLGGGVNYPVGQDPRALFGVEPLPSPTRLRAALRQHLLVARRGHRHERFVLRGAELPALPARLVTTSALCCRLASARR